MSDEEQFDEQSHKENLNILFVRYYSLNFIAYDVVTHGSLYESRNKLFNVTISFELVMILQE